MKKHRKPDRPPRKFQDFGHPDYTTRYTVAGEFIGERLDRTLVAVFPWQSRTAFQRAILAGEVRVGGELRDAGYRLKAGEEVALVRSGPPGEVVPIPLEIIFEDRWMLALNKGPGQVVHPVGSHLYDTILNTLHLAYRKPDDPARDVVPRLCHRIDKDTTGVLLVAKDAAVHAALYRQFETRTVRKRYLAIVSGEPPSAGLIDLSLEPDPAARRKKMRVARDGGLASTTGFERLQVGPGRSLVRLFPRTGRQHQIRVHLAAIGHPILCDEVYGNPAPVVDPADGRTLLARQALHAEAISFRHPATGEEMTISAPMAADMEAVMAYRSASSASSSLS